MRVGLSIAGLFAVCCVASACSTSHRFSIVALGDSVPRGTNCDCRPYPPLTADHLTRGRDTATATNDAVGGATSADVLDQLTGNDAVIGHVQHADAVEIEVGANDVGYSKSCGTSVECYAPKLPSLEQNLHAILARVHELTAGHKALVVLLDYWSVWLGGQYAAARGPAYVEAAEAMTARVNAIIKSTAAAGGSSYVDLRAAFKGPDYAYDETRFLSSDGDHPNAAGHEQIATAVDAVLDRELPGHH